MNIKEIRKLFPVTQEKIYLNHASTGPIASTARKAIEELLDVYEREVDITKEFLDAIEDEVRQLAAQLVGAHEDDDNGSESGSAYVFYRNEGGVDTWGQQAKLLLSDGALRDRFGISVSLSGDYAIVGIV